MEVAANLQAAGGHAGVVTAEAVAHEHDGVAGQLRIVLTTS